MPLVVVVVAGLVAAVAFTGGVGICETKQLKWSAKKMRRVIRHTNEREMVRRARESLEQKK